MHKGKYSCLKLLLFCNNGKIIPYVFAGLFEILIFEV